MANISDAHGAIFFDCDQSVMEEIYRQIEEQKWYYGHPELEEMPKSRTWLEFYGIGRWLFANSIERFFETLNPMGPVTVKWDFVDYEPGMEVFYTMKCETAYNPDAEYATELIVTEDYDLEINAENLEAYGYEEMAADTFTDYGLFNLQAELEKRGSYLLPYLFKDMSRRQLVAFLDENNLRITDCLECLANTLEEELHDYFID
ncbi:hypothetical protein ACLGL1_06940 [Peptococcus simiae]|uniref:hypothetical protein n=1 Tax=Peptococcus simiae TaxID=1643805 RepID=UPI0039813C6B